MKYNSTCIFNDLISKIVKEAHFILVKCQFFKNSLFLDGFSTLEIGILLVILLLFWTRVRTRTRDGWTRNYPDPGLKINRVFGRSSNTRLFSLRPLVMVATVWIIQTNHHTSVIVDLTCYSKYFGVATFFAFVARGVMVDFLDFVLFALIQGYFAFTYLE